MKTRSLRHALNAICLCAAVGVGTALPAAEGIRKFDGYYAGRMVDLEGKEIGLFLAPTRKGFEQSSRPAFSAQKLLQKIAKDATDIRGHLDLAKSAVQTGLFDTVEKGKAKDGLCIVFLPKKETTIRLVGRERTLRPFSQGTLTSLKDIETEFGPPTEKEKFEGELCTKLGFDGLVCWWADVGVAVSSDGAVTHVLVRAAP